MELLEFEETVKKLDRNKYKVGRILGFVDGTPKIEKWDIFSRESGEKIVLLSSDKGNTLEDIKKILEESK